MPLSDPSDMVLCKFNLALQAFSKVYFQCLFHPSKTKTENVSAKLKTTLDNVDTLHDHLVTLLTWGWIHEALRR